MIQKNPKQILDEALARLQKAEEQLKLAEADIMETELFLRKWGKANKNVKLLADYYTTHWLSDVQLCEREKISPRLRCEGQDPIWNALSDFHEQKLDIIKKVAGTF